MSGRRSCNWCGAHADPACRVSTRPPLARRSRWMLAATITYGVLAQEARERRIISQCETFHRNPAGNQSRPAEPGQQPEASLAWCRATVPAKRRQRDQTLCDRAPKVVSKRGNGPSGPRGAKGAPRCGRGVGTTPRPLSLTSVSPRNDLVVRGTATPQRDEPGASLTRTPGSVGGAKRSCGCVCYDWTYNQDITRCTTTGTLPRRAAGVIRRCEALGTT